MSKKEAIAPEMLPKLLCHEAETGRLFWRERSADMFQDGAQSAAHAAARWNSRNAGKEAFTFVDNHGYRCGGIHGRLYKAHRVIWALETGRWPVGGLDHIDRNPENNRFENLREATQAENLRNKSSARNASSKYLGVSWYAQNKKWVASIRVSEKKIYLGCFENEKDAALAYDAAARKHFGEFANPNFPDGEAYHNRASVGLAA
jgi:hypothetical protein